MLTKTDLSQIEKIVGQNVREEIKIGLRPVKSDIAKIRKGIDIIVDSFDKEYLDLRRRVERIEEHLNLSPIN